ncbi:MAG: hypothetical protein H7Z10_06235 [Gemmatimonadaceae bacterium]|nr:hypothetical protein [Acetobacteraceae bacterium]
MVHTPGSPVGPDRGRTPSMRQRIDMADIYWRALMRMPPDIDGQPPVATPIDGARTLEDLLGIAQG